MIKLPPLKGFGLMPNRPRSSPYAVALLGVRDVPQRSRLSINLMRRDVEQMGHNKINIDDSDFKFSCLQAIQNFKLEERIIPYHLNDIFFLPLDIRRSSPGIPWQPYYKTKGEVMDCSAARGLIRWYWHSVKKGLDVVPPDTRVLYRAHFMDGDTPKIRAVYGYPATLTFGEAQFALPLIEGYKKGSTPLAYGFDMALGGASKLRRALLKYNNYCCIDFRKFDKTVSEQLIRMAFSVLEQNIDFTHYRDHGIPDARRLYRAWEHLIEYFIYTNVRMPSGDRYKKTAGIPSGSYFTQLIGSIVNYICLTYACLKLNGKLPKYIIVFGDDSVFAIDDPVDIYDFARVIDSIGMEINIKKSVMTTNVDEVEFLGFCIAGGFPQRDYEKWMASLYCPEYPDASWDEFQSRALGLLYANHGVQPDFDAVCRAVISCSPFKVCMSRDFSRFLKHVGIDPEGLSTTPPSRREMMFALLG